MTQISILRDAADWTDLPALQRRGRVIEISDEKKSITVAAMPGALASGRAAVAIRVDLPSGIVLIVKTSLRSVWSAAVALVGIAGEPFMQVQPHNDVIEQANCANAELIRQLIELKARVGDPLTIDMSRADAEYEKYIAAKKVAGK